MQKNNFDLIVIGAGPCGLMCSGLVAKEGKSVLLLDKNAKVGRKLMITGKGRCNVTNDCNTDKFFSCVMKNSRFLYSSYSNFNSQDTMDFFENLGIPLKVERGNRVFPVSDKAVDIVDALYDFIKSSGVIFKQNTVMSVEKQNELFFVKTADDSIYKTKKVLICTGGLSYPLTGSTGDGYVFAKKFGHKITKQRASIVPIDLAESYCQNLMGLSLKNVSLYVYYKNKLIWNDLGEMMFTHFGISGPLVLTASSYISDDITHNSLFIDFKPGLTYEMLDKRLLRDFAVNQNKSISNVLTMLLPKSIIKYVLSQAQLSLGQQINEITKEQRKKLIDTIKHFKLTPKKLRPISEAVVTRGGIDVNEINPKTMESKLVPNLYFGGEIIDVDAVTGGFNLQIAFSTANSAKRGILEE